MEEQASLLRRRGKFWEQCNEFLTEAYAPASSWDRNIGPGAALPHAASWLQRKIADSLPTVISSRLPSKRAKAIRGLVGLWQAVGHDNETGITISECFLLEETAPGGGGRLTGRGVVAGGGPPEDDFILAEVKVEQASATNSAFTRLSWVQRFSDGDETEWRATVAGAGKRLIDGVWQGAGDGTFTATRLSPRDAREFLAIAPCVVEESALRQAPATAAAVRAGGSGTTIS